MCPSFALNQLVVIDRMIGAAAAREQLAPEGLPGRHTLAGCRGLYHDVPQDLTLAQHGSKHEPDGLFADVLAVGIERVPGQRHEATGKAPPAQGRGHDPSPTSRPPPPHPPPTTAPPLRPTPP